MGHYIGQRLSFDFQACTVRYIGPVRGTAGDWLGVEWDDPSRGKHDGQHQSVRYFGCLSRAATAGSFVRPSRSSDKPQSFLEGLRKKYVETDTAQHVYFNGKLAEEIGFDKIRRQLAALQDLRIVILDGMCVTGLRSGLDDGIRESLETGIEEIFQTCPSIRQLDLSRNLLEHWVDVAAICKPLSALSSLDLSRNRFHDLQTDWHCHESFTKITDLTLDSTLLSWTQLLGILKDFPSITVLSLVSNQLSYIPAGLPSSLKTLTLADNDFTSLHQLSELANLSLERLSLQSCPLSSLEGQPLPTVEFLDIHGTQLPPSDLPAFFPSLKSLRCSVTTENDSLRLIAQIRNLTTLNYTTITPAARRDAELFYLSEIAKQLASAPPAQESTILLQHARWAELCSLHGEPTVKRVEFKAADKLSARFVVLFISDRRSEQPEDALPDMQLYLPKSWNLYRVYASVADKLDVLPAHLRLVWETNEWDPVNRVENDLTRFEEPAVDDGALVKRKVILEPGPRELGFWIESGEAHIRVESRI